MRHHLIAGTLGRGHRRRVGDRVGDRVGRRLGATVVAVSLLGLTACGDGGSPAAAQVSDAAAGGLVSPAAAQGLAGDVTVIDVRTPEEFAQGHLDGAALIDFYGSTFADEIRELDRDGAYLVYCRSGNRSGQAVALMQELGFEQVYDLDGGVVAWSAAGLPLTP